VTINKAEMLVSDVVDTRLRVEQIENGDVARRG
jgi:hypothetical protein